MGPNSALAHYPTKINGAAFTAEIGFRRVKFWLADQGKRRIVNVSDLRSVRIQANGYTKLVLRLQRDLLVPTSYHEAAQLVKTLNAVLSERRATEQRRREALKEYEARDTSHYVRRLSRPGRR